MAADIVDKLAEAFPDEAGERKRIIGEAIDWIRNMRRENGYLRRSVEELMRRGEEKSDQ